MLYCLFFIDLPNLLACFKSAKDITFYEDPDDPETVKVSAGAGVKMSYLTKHTARHGLTGLEALAGIPGSLGGSLIMNAGSEGTEIGESVLSITRISSDGQIQVLNREDLTFHYRKTSFPPGGGIIVEAEFDIKN